LARQLIRAGLGVPHEYFNRVNSSKIIPRAFGGDRDAADVSAYVDWLEANRTTPSGIFAAKLHWPHLEDNPMLLQSWLREPGTVCLFLHRKRLLAQAVSYQSSMHSGIWDVAGEVSTMPRTLFGLSAKRETDQLAYRLVMWNGLWRFLFEANEIDVVDLAYEDFVADQSKTIADIAALLDVACHVPEPEVHKRSGTTTNVDVRNEYVSTWANTGARTRSLGYSMRFTSGAMLDAARRGAKRIRALPTDSIERNHK
jgi:LPS sulfotransferase NodH